MYIYTYTYTYIHTHTHIRIRIHTASGYSCLKRIWKKAMLLSQQAIDGVRNLGMYVCMYVCMYV